MSIKTAGYCAQSKDTKLEPFHYEVRQLREDDVHVKVKYCGICHSDVSFCKNEWMLTHYPVVPGHEIAGVVEAVGPKVTKYKVGDHVGVGCYANSCLDCDQCNRDLEQYCPKGTLTYSAPDPIDGRWGTGGFGRDIVVRERFVLNMRDLPLEKAAPLLCAGITTYSPLRKFGLDKPGKKVGVVGLGGLGHCAVLLAKAMGTEVVVISSSENKKEAAFQLGADKFLLSRDPEQLKAAEDTLDGIIDTACCAKDYNAYMRLLRANGTFVQVGAPPLHEMTVNLNPADIIFKRKGYAGSNTGGMKELQEMLDFCSEHKVVPWTELIRMDQVNEAFQRIDKQDIKFRFVIDVGNTAPIAE